MQVAEKKPRSRRELVPATIKSRQNHMYFVEGAKGEAVEEYCHIWAGSDDDPLGRTESRQKLYLAYVLRVCNRLYPDVTFTTVYRNHEGEEILL